MLARQFERQVNQNAARPALRIDDRDYTYAQLWTAANALAARLQSRGVGRGDRVCLLLDKSFELYAAVWGVWLAGAAYVPLAPSYPANRLRSIVERARPKMIWHDSTDAWQRLAIASDGAEPIGDVAAMSDQAAAVDLTSDDLAYVLFTSGSTGTPKGVMVSHGNVTAFVEWARTYFALSADDRLSGHSDLTFDLSVFDTFVAHTSGACLVPVITSLDRTTPGDFIRRHRISVWFSVPSVLSAMTSLGADTLDADLAALRWMAFCGEPLLPAPVRRIMTAAPQLRVANLYGPTEATVACAAHTLAAPPAPNAAAVPFGWRTGGTEVFVWTEGHRVASTGERGEVYIVGDQVGPGYFDDEVETARRFVPDPRGTAMRCFRTGDLATVEAEGPVFNMRLDHQVKFRGWRIELGDIERALAAIPGMVECAAALIRRDGKTDALAAFVRSAEPTNAPAILKQLRAELPEYMIPTHVRIVADFPRTLNSKIDRARLAELL